MKSIKANSQVTTHRPWSRVMLPGGSFTDRMGAVACWNAVMDENQYMVRKWNEFIAA